MKSNKRQISTVTQPILKDLVDRQKASLAKQASVPSKLANSVGRRIGTRPVPSPELYQDAGGGYNSNFTFPQDSENPFSES